MKPVLFIDNDNLDRSIKDYELYVLPFIIAFGKLDENKLIPFETPEYLSEFYKSDDQDKVLDKLFKNQYILISFSVYTIQPGICNSYTQVIRLLRTAGKVGVKKILYIDVSGLLLDRLVTIKYLDIKQPIDVLIAVTNNYIVTFKDAAFHRICIDFKNPEIFYLEPISLNDLV